MIVDRSTKEVRVTHALRGVHPATQSLRAIARLYGMTVLVIDDASIRKSRMPHEEFVNRSFMVGNEIQLGLYNDDELLVLSFFHELGHVVPTGTLHTFDREAEAWQEGFRLAEKYGFIFSAKAIAWAFAQLQTYATHEWIKPGPCDCPPTKSRAGVSGPRKSVVAQPTLRVAGSKKPGTRRTLPPKSRSKR